ncbi:hypothetical protein THAOC_33617, partial [Thalassiosira oceanica]
MLDEPSLLVRREGGGVTGECQGPSPEVPSGGKAPSDERSLSGQPNSIPSPPTSAAREIGKRAEVAPPCSAPPVASSSPRRHSTSSRRAPKDDAIPGNGEGAAGRRQGRAYRIVGPDVGPSRTRALSYEFSGRPVAERGGPLDTSVAPRERRPAGHPVVLRSPEEAARGP